MLIIEDNDAISFGLKADFSFDQYVVTISKNGKEGLELALSNQYDIIILDIMLPGMNGIDVCRNIRGRNVQTPILMLTAKSQEIDKIMGLEFGADDYVTKPFSPRELRSRVKALIRRNNMNNQVVEQKSVHIGDLSINFDSYELFKFGKKIPLTHLEFKMLRLLIENVNKVLTREYILEKAWGDDIIVDQRTVDAHIAKIRKKIEDNKAQPKYIIGIRGVGYKFCTQ